MSLEPRPEYPADRRFVAESRKAAPPRTGDRSHHLPAYALSVPPPPLSVLVGWFWLIASGLYVAAATILGAFALYTLRVPDYTGGPRVPDHRPWAVALYSLVWVLNAVRVTGAWGLIRAENGTGRAKRAWFAVFAVCLIQIVEYFRPVMYLGYTSNPPRISPTPLVLAAGATLLILLLPQVLRWAFTRPLLVPTWEYGDERGAEWAEAALRDEVDLGADKPYEGLFSAPGSETPGSLSGAPPTTPPASASTGTPLSSPSSTEYREGVPPLPVIPYEITEDATDAPEAGQKKDSE